MKKYLIVCAAIGLWLLGITQAAYQQQWFNQFSESGDTISFWCQNSCVLMLGEKEDNDLIRVAGGTHQWDGQWGYGYLLWQNIYASTLLPAASYEWSFADDPIYKQLPAGENKVLFLVTWPLKADNVQIEMRQRGQWEAFGWAWKRFWNVENIAPYSVNLHHGPMIGSWSWPFFGFIVMLIAVVIIYIVRKKMTLKQIITSACVVLVTIMIVWGVRLLYDDIRIVNSTQRQFSSESRKFLELNDYIAVTEKLRDYLHLDNISEWKDKKCSIYAKSNADWPFVAHWWAVYLRPCEIVQTWSVADYALFYNVPADIATGTLALTGDSFILYNLRP